jgi:hypothetical protein
MGGQIFSVSLFHARVALYLRASAIFPCGRGRSHFSDL